MDDDYRVTDNLDGTWRVDHYHPNTGTRLNAEFFPAEQEARWYAAAMNGGCLRNGALIRVHENRLAHARARTS